MMLELLSPYQIERLKGGRMKPFIQAATRAKCLECEHQKFLKKKKRGFENQMPVCEQCGDYPNLFRVTYSYPIVGGNSFQKTDKTIDQIGNRLDTPSRADAFCEFVKSKLSPNVDDDFDPRELGSKEEREFLLVKNCIKEYIKDQRERVDLSNEEHLTGGAYGKKEKVKRLYLVPLFGEYSVKQLNYQLISKVIKKSKHSDNTKRDIITELSVFLGWACEQSLIKAKPQLPKKPKIKTLKSDRIYSLSERNLVIRNIKNRKMQIAIMILANYTRRKSEITCLKWGSINFKNKKITFSSHTTDGPKGIGMREEKGLKSSPDSTLTFDFFPSLHEMLLELNPSLDPNELVFKNIRGKMWSKNVFYEHWMKSVKDLVKRKILTREVDLHRGTRNSTLTGGLESGMSFDVLVELYGGDIDTMKKHYLLKDKQNLGSDWQNSVHFVN